MSKHGVVQLVLLCAASLFFSTSTARGDETAYAGTSWVTNCTDWADLECGSYLLNNNVWNKGDVTGYKQCIHLNASGGKCRFKWSWDWPNIGDYNVRSYPEVIFGQKPWMKSSTTPEMPIRVSNSVGITAHVDIQEYADDWNGVWNTSFDIWIVKGPIPTPDNIKAEVMVWIKPNQHIPVPNRIGAVNVNGEIYDVYKADFGWKYFSFAKRVPTLKGDIPIGRLVNYLKKHGHILGTDYVACVELGNEVRFGKGYTILRNYAVKVH